MRRRIGRGGRGTGDQIATGHVRRRRMRAGLPSMRNVGPGRVLCPLRAALNCGFLVELRGLEVLARNPPKCPLSCLDGFSASCESTRNDVYRRAGIAKRVDGVNASPDDESHRPTSVPPVDRRVEIHVIGMARESRNQSLAVVAVVKGVVVVN